MNTFSIYEFLAYLLPGFGALYALNSLFNLLGFSDLIQLGASFELSILNLGLALFLGLLIHALSMELKNGKNTFWLAKCYRTHLHQNASMFILKDDGLTFVTQEILSFWETCEPKRSFLTEQGAPNYGKLFSFAYYYLHNQNKITHTRSFQSVLFLVQNLFTLVLLFIIMFAITQGVLFFTYQVFQPVLLAIVIISCVCLVIVLPLLANRYREKMIRSLFSAYYTDLMHLQIKK